MSEFTRAIFASKEVFGLEDMKEFALLATARQRFVFVDSRVPESVTHVSTVPTSQEEEEGEEEEEELEEEQEEEKEEGEEGSPGSPRCCRSRPHRRKGRACSSAARPAFMVGVDSNLDVEKYLFRS